jgi:hypothetical protein
MNYWEQREKMRQKIKEMNSAVIRRLGLRKVVPIPPKVFPKYTDKIVEGKLLTFPVKEQKVSESNESISSTNSNPSSWPLPTDGGILGPSESSSTSTESDTEDKS